jgi:hypothetical protein
MTKRKTSLTVERLPVLLLLGKPFGAYKVDAHTDLLFPNAVDDVSMPAPSSPVVCNTVKPVGKPDAGNRLVRFVDLSMTNQDPRAPVIALMRDEVNRAAQIAVARAHHERAARRKERENAKRLIGLFDHVEREVAEIFPAENDEGTKNDDATKAAEIAVGFGAGAATALVQIIEGFGSLASWVAELRRIGIAEPPPSRSDPLARSFIDAMASAYRARCGEQPPATRSGPFVDLLAAAWSDLGLLVPAGSDLPEWLGTKVERRAATLPAFDLGK